MSFMEQQEYINLENFDREYGLADLFPPDLAAGLLRGLADHMAVFILREDGRPYFGKPQNPRHFLEMYKSAGRGSQKTGVCLKVAGRLTAVYPLSHEMETIGWLVFQENEGAPSIDVGVAAEFAATAFNRVIHLKYRDLLTSGLHGQVVEESYNRLKEKARQLQRSETRYRMLAQNLELEVERKTAEIRDTQLMMLHQEKLASVGQLAAGVAHEINNPIGFIISNLNTLGASAEDLSSLLARYAGLVDVWLNLDGEDNIPQEVLDEIANINRLKQKLDIEFIVEDSQALVAESLDGAERIKDIVQNLREFTHPSVKTQETVDLNQCLDTTLTILSGQIGNAVQVKKRYGDIPPVQCFLREINQLFFNVIMNALQAVGSSGEIIISTAAQNNGEVEIIISDTGCGIREEHLAFVFDPFFTTREVGRGIGLGLYVAHNIAQKHNGRIDVKSAEGGGSEFRIRLPHV